MISLGFFVRLGVGWGASDWAIGWGLVVGTFSNVVPQTKQEGASSAIREPQVGQALLGEDVGFAIVNNQRALYQCSKNWAEYKTQKLQHSFT